MSKKPLSYLLMSLLSSVLLFNCDKENDPKSGRCYPATFKTTLGSWEVAQTFVYDNDRLTKITFRLSEPGAVSEIIRDVHYNTQGDISEMVASDDTREVYTYNASGQVIKIEEFENGVLQEFSEHEYTNDQMIKVQHYEKSSYSSFIKSNYELYEYASASSGNPIKMKSYYSSGFPDQTIEFEYDSKKNPYAADPTIFKLMKAHGIQGENNFTKQTIIYPDGSSDQVIKYTYEYNSQGYPVKHTATFDFLGIPSTSTSNYTYNCN